LLLRKYKKMLLKLHPVIKSSKKNSNQELMTFKKKVKPSKLKKKIIKKIV